MAGGEIRDWQIMALQFSSLAVLGIWRSATTYALTLEFVIDQHEPVDNVYCGVWPINFSGDL
jgi:hypothetical protein